MDTVWRRTSSPSHSNQSLVLAMEDEAQWMIENNLTGEKEVPDFREYINTKSLEEIKPGSVRITG